MQYRVALATVSADAMTVGPYVSIDETLICNHIYSHVIMIKTPSLAQVAVSPSMMNMSQRILGLILPFWCRAGESCGLLSMSMDFG